MLRKNVPLSTIKMQIKYIVINIIKNILLIL